MDAPKFDCAARAFARGASRRAAVRILAAGVLGGFGRAFVTADDAAACSSFGEFCQKTKDCCGKLVCILKECQDCLKIGAHCKDDPDCCSKNCDKQKCKKKR